MEAINVETTQRLSNGPARRLRFRCGVLRAADAVRGDGPGGRRLRLGTRFEATHTAFGVELSGERREGGAGGPEHALRLDLRLRF